MTESADTDGTVRTHDRVFHPKILTTLRAYDGRTFLSDLGAGLTVAMVALPLAMAIAIASGANPGVGLVTAIVAGLTISALGGSRVQIGGPTGAFIVVVYAVIADHGYDGLVIATFMAGLILLIAGFLRAGSLIRHIPEPVINGFTIGIAVIIASSQVADFFGLGVEGKMPADFLPKLAVLWEASGSVSVPSAIVALATLVMIVLFRRAAPKLPGLVVAVGLTSAAVAMFELDVDTIASRFGAIAPHLPFPSLPELSFDRIVELLPSAIIIAFLAGVESLLSALVADRMAGTAHRSNTEVVAQGAANCVSALFGGLPATGAIARTATNIRAGAKTPVAGIMHSLFLLAFMMFAAPLAGLLALPALAAVLVLTAWNMAEPQHFMSRIRTRRSDQLLLVMTLLLTVLADLTVAIGAGVAVGLMLRLRRRGTPEPDWQAPDR
ncbi:SulP family inorganic anion transporter [Hoeflea sp. EC-HK425]|uniref:SulP family inorganic anion transporter n=1 Tax=Hoeflea sp. EC-HK425 TaxID=2038388 RepID=UPI00125B00BC|nr:SulP family inorganic anion transporter [Hoeflea sp. EC-HK425]VVT29491.1 Sulfate permease [Hoeflea sp. EC-HK425]